MNRNTAIILSVVSALAAAHAWPAAAAGARVYTDAEIVGIVGAANQGELEAAALAANKTKSGGVATFAARMTKEHTDAKRKLDAVAGEAGIVPSDTDLSAGLKKSASDEASRLGLLNGDAFDAAYIDAQVSDHETLLREIDQDLIPDAKGAALRALLRKLRPAVAHHLAMARRLKTKLGAHSR